MRKRARGRSPLPVPLDVDTTGGQYDLFFAVALIGTATLTLLAVLSVVGGAW